MNCMKCGRETRNEQVFCQDCLRVMQRYPVESGTVVFLPRRRDPVVKKTVKRSVISQDEQIRMLRKQLGILWIILTICIAAIVLMIKPTLHYVLDEHVEIGQNYSTVSASSPTPTSGE